MRRTLLVLFVLLLTAVAALAVDVTGTWKGSMDTPNGALEVSLNLKADGNALTGAVTVMGSETKIEKGKLDGDKISFEVNPENFGTVAYAGTVNGDSMNLKVKVMDNEMPLVLKRAK
jgi:hypothetical protein